jgi:hypothetical protein
MSFNYSASGMEVTQPQIKLTVNTSGEYFETLKESVVPFCKALPWHLFGENE